MVRGGTENNVECQWERRRAGDLRSHAVGYVHEAEHVRRYY